MISGTGGLLVLLGASDGSFGSPQAYAASAGVRGVGLADLTGDGHLDVAVGTSGPWGMAVFRGRGDGTLRAPSHYTGAMGLSLAIDDMNGDGLLDVLTCWSRSRSS